MSGRTVFLSYRRDALGSAFARSLELVLTTRGYDVFLDVGSVDAGRWEDQILPQAQERDHFLLIVTPGALDRCADANDFVRLEYLAAVGHRRNVVPVCEESVDVNAARSACPGVMKSLFDYQGVVLRHGSFAADVGALVARFISPHNAPAATTLVQPAGHATTRFDIGRIIKYAPAMLLGREAETAALSDAWERTVRNDGGRPRIVTFVALGGEGKTSVVAKWVAELSHRGWPGCDSAFAWSFYSQGTRELTAASSDAFLREALTFFGEPVSGGSVRSAEDKGRRLAQIVGDRCALLILDGLEPLQNSPSSRTPGRLKDAGIASLLNGLATNNRGLCLVTTRYSIQDLKGYWETAAPQIDLQRLSAGAGTQLLRRLGVIGSPQELVALVESVNGHALTIDLFGRYLHDAHAGDACKRNLIRMEEAVAEEQGGHAFRVMDAYARWFESEGDESTRVLAMWRLVGLFDRPMTADCLDALLRLPAIPDLTEKLVAMTVQQRNVAVTRLDQAKLLSAFWSSVMAGDRSLISLDTHPLIREYFAMQLRTRFRDAWRAAHERIYEHLASTTRDKARPELEDLQPLYQAVAHGCLAGLQQDALERIYVARILRPTHDYTWKKLGVVGANLRCLASFFERPWSRVSPVIAAHDHSRLLMQAALYLRVLGRFPEAVQAMKVVQDVAVEKQDWKNAASAAGNVCELQVLSGDVSGAVDAADGSVAFADRHRNELQLLSEEAARAAGGADRSAAVADRHHGEVGHPASQKRTEIIHQQRLRAHTTALMRATQAQALHHAGRFDDAMDAFRVAEEFQADSEPDYPMLYALPGFRYCELLLAHAERAAWQCMLQKSLPPERQSQRNSRTSQCAVCRVVFQRAARTLSEVGDHPGLAQLESGLDLLTKGRAALYEAILRGAGRRRVRRRVVSPKPEDRVPEYVAAQGRGTRLPLRLLLVVSEACLEAAAKGIRHAGQRELLPNCLLARAWLNAIHGMRSGEQRGQPELDEAWELAQGGAMPTVAVDVLLQRARLFGAMPSATGGAKYPWISAQEDLSEARRLVETHGYERRMAELEDAEAALLS